MDLAAISAKEQLAWAYRLMADWGVDDHTYTHLSCRAEPQSYYLAPFGKRFEEIHAQDLLEVQIKTHKILSGVEITANQTAYYLHSPIYQEHPHIGAIFHLHTPEIIAVSVDPAGLRPLSQWALHFHENTAYYDYDSLLLSKKHSAGLIKQISNKSVIFMRHHGVIVLGKTIWEAVFLMHHLQKACYTQCLALSSCSNPMPIPAKIAKKSYQDLMCFEENLGWRDWCAWIRYLHNKECKKPLSLVKGRSLQRAYGRPPSFAISPKKDSTNL